MQSEHSMRTVTTAFLLMMTLTGVAAAQDSTAPADTNSPPPAAAQERPLVGGTNGLGSVWQAPVGHRQPTQNSLPPAARQDERSAGDGERVVDPFSNVPNICTGC
jgi:hypothetical protein